MEKYIKVVAVCPFLNGKPCIQDGLTHDVLMYKSVAHPCMFWDSNIYKDVDEEPCLILRAVKKTLGIKEPEYTETEVDVPFDYGRKGDVGHGRKKT